MKHNNAPTDTDRAQAVAQFRNDLTAIGPEQIYRLPDLTGYINHEAKPTRPGVDVKPGMFIDTEALGVHRLSGGRSDGSDFWLQPINRFTREDSHNMVFFGKLFMYGNQRNAATETQVAVKPVNKVKDGLGELAMFQYMQSLGLPTFKPVAFSTHPNNKSYLLTKFNKPVATMDSIDWRALNEVEKWQQVRHGTDTLALLHSNMLFHGDTEFRNIAFNDVGEVVIIDPELMYSAKELAEVLKGTRMNGRLDIYESRVFDGIKSKMRDDFTWLCRSVNKFVLGSMPRDRQPQTAEAIFSQYRRHVYLPYRAALQDIGSGYLPILERAYDDLLADRKQEARQGII